MKKTGCERGGRREKRSMENVQLMFSSFAADLRRVGSNPLEGKSHLDMDDYHS